MIIELIKAQRRNKGMFKSNLLKVNFLKVFTISKNFKLFLILTLPFLTQFSCNTTEPTDDIKPGRRDYVWSIDSISGPGVPYLQSIWGSSPTDVWGAGFSEDVRNCLWHFDGVSWKRATEGTPITELGNGSKIVGGVWGTAQSDVWAFGGRLFSNPERTEPFIMHYDGNQWTEVIGDKGQMPIGFRDIYAVRKDHFWISSSEYVSEYIDGIWKKYSIADNYIIPSIEGIGNSVYLTAYPIGVDSLYLMKLVNNEFIKVDFSTLFGSGKFGHFGLNFGVNNVFTFDSYGIYEAMVTGEVINTSSWQTIIRKNGKGFANCIKLSNKNIWAVGNYIYPYHFNGADWQEIDIYSGNEPITGNVFWGIWGNEKEIFICDTQNGIIYHGK